MLGGVIGTIIGWVGYHLGQRTDAASAAGSLHAKATDIKNYLVNTVNAKIGTSSDARASNTVMGWLATQVKSVQRGTTTTSNPSATATISPVDTAKAVVIPGQIRVDSAAAGATNPLMSCLATVELTNSTTVTVARVGTVGTITVTWQVIEFY